MGENGLLLSRIPQPFSDKKLLGPTPSSHDQCVLGTKASTGKLISIIHGSANENVPGTDGSLSALSTRQHENKSRKRGPLRFTSGNHHIFNRKNSKLTTVCADEWQPNRVVCNSELPSTVKHFVQPQMYQPNMFVFGFGEKQLKLLIISSDLIYKLPLLL